MKIRRLMVLAPHCDDAELGCGGTIARVVRAGGEALSVVATTSDQDFLHLERTVTADERVAEFSAASEVLGAMPILLTRGYEAKLHLYPMGKLVQDIDRHMKEFAPDTVLIPLPSSHQDHVYMYQAGLAACRPSRSKDFIRTVAAYEYPSTGWGPGGESAPSHGGMYVNITETMEAKKQALSMYKTQMRDGTNSLLSVEGAEILARLRGVEAGFRYAELFRVLRMSLA